MREKAEAEKTHDALSTASLTARHFHVGEKKSFLYCYGKWWELEQLNWYSDRRAG